MTIAAKYEHGVFRPLEDVTIEEGTLAEVHVLSESVQRKAGSRKRAGEPPRKHRSIKDLPFYGMWAGRGDIADGVSYVDKLRDNPRP